MEVRHLQGAFELVEYSMAERINYSDMADNEPNDMEKLLTWLIKQNTNKIAYAFAQCNVGVRALRKKEPFALAIELLDSTNHVKITDDGGKRFILINPKLLK